MIISSFSAFFFPAQWHVVFYQAAALLVVAQQHLDFLALGKPEHLLLLAWDFDDVLPGVGVHINLAPHQQGVPFHFILHDFDALPVGPAVQGSTEDISTLFLALRCVEA